MKTVALMSMMQSKFDGETIKEHAMGGADTAIYYLAKYWANHDVNVHLFIPCDKPGIYDKVHYHDINSSNHDDLLKLEQIDLMIINRNPILLKFMNREGYNIKKLVFYTQDMATDSIWKELHPYVKYLDWIIAVSDWHKQDIIENQKISPNKILVTSNGVNLDYYREPSPRIHGKCYYASTPYRGLGLLLQIWPEIHEKVPGSELFIYSSMKTYGDHYDDSEYTQLYEIAKRMKGVRYIGSIAQKHLAENIKQSELLLYPNTFNETSCITALEARAARTPIITSAKGALIESVGSHGVLIQGSPFSIEYRKTFIKSAIGLLTDESAWRHMSDASKISKEELSWDTIANAWLRDLIESDNKEPDLRR